MRLDRSVLFVSLICALWCPRLASAQVRPPEHPLEGLMSAEYWTVHEVLQASGKVDADTLVMSVLNGLAVSEYVEGNDAQVQKSYEMFLALLAAGGRQPSTLSNSTQQASAGSAPVS